jgi:two-component system chemotaxis response regulator CheB
VRELLVHILQSDPELRVVGVASDGLEAVNLASQLRPDVITMDIRMPRMNGFQATKRIMQQVPTPIVVVSASVQSEELKITFNAIQAGALTVVEKPSGPAGPAFEAIREQLIATIKLMSDVQVVRRWATGMLQPHQPVPRRDLAEVRTALVGIAASTGGPGALYQLLRDLPADFPAPVLVVQHIARGFGQGMVDWLAGGTGLKVETAREGVVPQPGSVLVAPDDRHLRLGPDGRVALQPRIGERELCPSADRLFESVAGTLGRKAMGVIMTGMGRDGVEGLRRLKAAGGKVLAQDEKSCVVFGMPKEAIAAGIVDRVVPLEQMAAAIVELL